MTTMTETKPSPDQVRLLHKNYEAMGKLRIHTELATPEIHRAFGLQLQTYEAFAILCEKYPLPK